MFAIEDIKDQVLENCDIADAHHAGLFSICGLALRLRDLYKWENGLEPWIEKESAEILDWIGKKEQQWEKLAGKDFKDIAISGVKYDPFDTEGVNAVLVPHGFFYGAGFARSLKPTFFLAAVESQKKVKGYPVYIFGRELARDLMTLPALSQDNNILIRQESARLFLWDQIFYIQKSGQRALSFALQHLGLRNHSPGNLHRHMEEIVASQTETYVYHELGELMDAGFDRNIWRAVIAMFPRTPIEIVSRAVKDLVSDTSEHGTLRYMIQHRNVASLAFYVAFLENLTKTLFPEIIDAFEEFTRTLNWNVIARAVKEGYKTARCHADAICSIFREGELKYNEKWIENEISNGLLKPLGVI